ncbi:Uncharacterized protein ToN1_43490 [Aromatoleum petrolei]|nr:Uncharacterized protein ToN1_43490 [Aromatoleum petrolei]
MAFRLFYESQSALQTASESTRRLQDFAFSAKRGLHFYM